MEYEIKWSSGSRSGKNFECTSFKILIKKYFFEYNLGIAHALLHNSINIRRTKLRYSTVRVPFFLWHSGPRIPGLNKRFGEPGLDSPQLTSYLRIKWYTGDAPDNKKKWQIRIFVLKNAKKKNNKVNSKGKKQD